MSSIAKLGTPEMVGEYSYAYALAAPIFMLFNLRLRFVQISDSNNETKFLDYLSFRLLSTMAALFALVVISQFLGFNEIWKLKSKLI